MRVLRGVVVCGVAGYGLLAWMATGGVWAAEEKTPPITPEQASFFETKVRPLLANNCYSCHGDGDQKAGLRVDSREAVLKGNTGGPVIVPGDPEHSRLIGAVHYEGAVKMPPAGKLKADEIAALAEWIKMGAPWPAAKAGAPTGKPGMVVTDAQRNRWPFARFSKPALPPVKLAAWCRTPIDRFILAKLEAKGLKPAPAADRRTLIRRATYDLIGLPPTPEEVAAFVNDKSSNAWEKVVDRLLASPHYGERWGRHWLDVARYSDSNGLDENKGFAYAYRYRDYVVNSFNKDKPYNQFLMEQLAGDLMPTDDEALRNERLTATGFLTLGAKVLAEQDKPKMVMDIVDEQIEVTSKAVLGLTVACARCHDHKFDPIPTKDYYALAGIFKSTKTMKNLDFVSEWNERQLMTRQLQADLDAHNKKMEGVQSALRLATERANENVQRAMVRHAAAYLLAGWELAQQPGMHPLADTPALPGESRQIIEAENYDRGNANKDFVVYGKGIGIIHTTALPTTAEWDVTVPKAGFYQIDLRYASGEKRPVHLMLNGKVVKADAAGQVTGSFQPEGQKWEAQGLYLFNAGKNTVRIECDNSIPHFDKLLIASVPTPSGTNAPAKSAQEIAATGKLDPALLPLWADRLRGAANDSVLSVWSAYAQLPAQQFPTAAAALSARFAQGDVKGVDPAVAHTFADFTPNSLTDVAARYAVLFDRAETGNDPALQAVRTKLNGKTGLLALPEKPETLYADADKATVKQTEMAVQKAESEKPQVPIVMAVEEGKPADCRVHIRGNTLTLGDDAPRHFLTVLGGDKMTPIDNTRSGRLELAQWLTQRDHSMTGRVFVNRVWQNHFGVGIVATADNFGLMGEKPTHTELLDWLAATFTAPAQSGGLDWSIKKLQRLILTSNTYKMSSVGDPKSDQVDPDNRLLSHMNRRRLEAEPFRDALLAVAGKLDLNIGGSLLTTADNDYVTNDQSGNAGQYGSFRRAIYLPIIRNALYDMFQAFDYGDPSMVNAHRPTTTVAPQALYVMNSPFVIDLAKAWATELLSNPTASDTERISQAYQKAFARPPLPAETQRVQQYIAAYEAHLKATQPEEGKRTLLAWRSLCQILLSSNEFIYIN
jgi:cytochrome c553